MGTQNLGIAGIDLGLSVAIGLLIALGRLPQSLLGGIAQLTEAAEALDLGHSSGRDGLERVSPIRPC